MPIGESLESSYRGVRVLVTGGAGFIGSHLVDALLKLHADVTVIDDLSNGSCDNIPDAPVRFVEASILSKVALEEAMHDAQVVFHQAAIASVPRSVEEPTLYHDVNSTGTLRVLEAARRLGVRRVVYAGSSSAYGDVETLPKRETDPLRPLSPYAATKLVGEHLISAYTECYDITGVTLRYFNVFGPRQRHDSPYAAVIPVFIEALRNGRPLTIYGDGEQTRDFTYVDNVVHGNLLAGDVSREVHGESINLACGDRISLNDLAGMLGNILGVTPDIDYQPVRTGDVKHSQADIALARRMLDFEPIVSFSDGLRKLVEQ